MHRIRILGICLTLMVSLGAQAATPNLVQGRKVSYYGGPVLANVKIYGVLWGSRVDPATRDGIGKFLDALTDSTYLDLLKQYSTTIRAVNGTPGTRQTIGRGHFAGLFQIRPLNRKTKLADLEIGAELLAQIRKGVLPRPDANTLYGVYLPPNYYVSIDGMTTCVDICAYHHFVESSFGQITYVVVPDMGTARCTDGCAYGRPRFGKVTLTSSHEIAEAITNPIPIFGPRLTFPNPRFPEAWVGPGPYGEIGDLCANQLTQLKTRDGAVFDVQQEFDNSIESCQKGPFYSPR